MISSATRKQTAGRRPAACCIRSSTAPSWGLPVPFNAPLYPAQASAYPAMAAPIGLPHLPDEGERGVRGALGADPRLVLAVLDGVGLQRPGHGVEQGHADTEEEQPDEGEDEVATDEEQHVAHDGARCGDHEAALLAEQAGDESGRTARRR